MIDAYASEPHYEAHIRPVMEALPPDVRGTWRGGDGKGPVIVSSYKDLWRMRSRPVIFMEHGAGQTYTGAHTSYAGSRHRGGVELFLCPSERVAKLNRAAHPEVPSVVVGCPKLDRWVTMPKPDTGIVGIAFHWNGTVCAETRTAFPYYSDALTGLSERFKVLGHAHPRVIDRIAREYDHAGISVAYTDGEMFLSADVLVVDNSSLGWEFLALDRPVIWLNAPWYRRDVEHGMRFWEYADAGVQVDRAHDLPDAIADVLAHDDRAARRREVADLVYAHRDGTAAARAARAICDLVA